jgi:hypothetical protein
MPGTDEELQTDRLFPAEGGLDHGRLGNGYQGPAVLFGAKSYAVLWDSYITSPYQWFEIWDFGYYQKIAEFGYTGTDAP